MAKLDKVIELDKMLGDFPNLAKAVRRIPNRGDLLIKDVKY